MVASFWLVTHCSIHCRYNISESDSCKRAEKTPPAKPLNLKMVTKIMAETLEILNIRCGLVPKAEDQRQKPNVYKNHHVFETNSTSYA
jgi:hypothetical protein